MIDIPSALEKLGIIQIDVWAIVISLLNLLILFLIVKKFLYKPVQKVLKQRKDSVDAVYAEAENARAAAEEDRQVYEEKRKNAEDEAEEILRKAGETAKKNGESIVKEAKEEAAAIKEKAERDIAQEKVKAINEAKDEIAGISIGIAEKIVGRELNDDDRNAYVDGLVKDLEKDE